MVKAVDQREPQTRVFKGKGTQSEARKTSACVEIQPLAQRCEWERWEAAPGARQFRARWTHRKKDTGKTTKRRRGLC